MTNEEENTISCIDFSFEFGVGSSNMGGEYAADESGACRAVGALCGIEREKRTSV